MRYKMLNAFADIQIFLAWLAFIAAVIVVAIGFWSATQDANANGGSFMMMFAIALGLATYGLTFGAFGQLIKVLMQIEENTRHAEENTRRIGERTWAAS